METDTKAMGIKEGMAQGGILLGVRPVLAYMPDIHASCVCCLGSPRLTAYDDDDLIHKSSRLHIGPASVCWKKQILAWV